MPHHYRREYAGYYPQKGIKLVKTLVHIFPQLFKAPVYLLKVTVNLFKTLLKYHKLLVYHFVRNTDIRFFGACRKKRYKPPSKQNQHYRCFENPFHPGSSQSELRPDLTTPPNRAIEFLP